MKDASLHPVGSLAHGDLPEVQLHDHVSLLNLIKSCQKEKDLLKSRTIHSYLLEKHILTKNVYIGNALVTTYAKCGVMEEAREVFEQLPVQDIVSWNALIAGYGQLGQANIALNLFVKMRTEGIIPDWVTFLVLLMGCGHAGLIKIGEKLFNDMRVIFCFTPALEHYTCMVDLFGRGGHVEKAIEIIKRMPSADYLPVWVTLLSACCKLGDVKLGRLAFEYAIQLDENHAGIYVCMRNIYASAPL